MKVEFIDLVVVNGAFLGLIFAPVFLFLQRGNRQANLFLGLISLCFSGYLLYACLGEFGILEKRPHLIRVYTVFGFLVGPLIYFYINACVKEHFRFKPIYWLHFLPVIIDILYSISFYNQTGPEKLDFYQAYVNGNSPWDFRLITRIKVIHALCYYAISVMLVNRYRKELPNKVSNIDNLFHQWLYYFCSALWVPLLMATIVVFGDLGATYPRLVSVGFFFFLVSLQIIALAKPEIFHVFPGPINDDEEDESTSENDKEEKYKGSTLQEPLKQKYVDRLLKFMEKDQPYQDPELSLKDLSEKVNIPLHYLSQVINEKLEQNFMDFINSYRVEEAKEKLSSSSFEQFTILSIAYDVGFNSKSAFYNAFKKFTGTTPTKYRKSQNIRA